MIEKIAPFGSDAFMPHSKEFSVEAFKAILENSSAQNSRSDLSAKLLSGVTDSEKSVLNAMSNNSVQDVILNANELELNAKALSRISMLLTEAAKDLINMQI